MRCHTEQKGTVYLSAFEFMRRLPPGVVTALTKLRVSFKYIPTVVEHTLVSAALGGLGLFLLFDLGRLRLDLTGTSERSVDLTHIAAQMLVSAPTASVRRRYLPYECS